MEITTVLPIRQLVIMSQQAAAAVSKPGRGQHAHRIVLARVEHGTLHYQARAGRKIQAVTVKFTAAAKITRVSVQGALDGPAARFAAALHELIQAADPSATCTRTRERPQPR
jgi:hypothetical protein